MSALTEQPPPRRGAKEGFYPDPLGSGRARWWDGANWTPTVGPKLPEGATKGKPLPLPKKVCRHCGTESETWDSTCPNCGKGYARASGWVIAAVIGAVVLFMIFLGGCAVVVGALISKADDEHSISKRQFDSVPLGATVASAERELGEPIDETHAQEPPYGRVLCLRYTQDGEGIFEVFNQYKLCFADGKLVTKDAP